MNMKWSKDDVYRLSSGGKKIEGKVEVTTEIGPVATPVRDYLLGRDQPKYYSDLPKKWLPPMDQDDFFEKVENINNMYGFSQMRHDYCRQYSWAVPNRSAIEKLVSVGPVIEMGAGSGFWAYLVEQAGGTIIPFDTVEGRDHYNWNDHFLLIHNGGSEVLRYYPDHTLFLCWPPMADFGANCLKAFMGNKFVYVGEWAGGCTGDDELFEIIDKEWEEVEEIGIPQWYGIHDVMVVYERKQS